MTFARRIEIIAKRLFGPEARTKAGRCLIAKKLDDTKEEAEFMDEKLEAAMQHAVRSAQDKEAAIQANAKHAQAMADLKEEHAREMARRDDVYRGAMMALQQANAKLVAEKQTVERTLATERAERERQISTYVPDDYTTRPEGS